MSESRQLVRSDVNANAVAEIGDRSLARADRLDLSQSIGFFRRRLKLILGVTALVVLAGLAFTVLTDETYTAKATVVLTNEAGESLVSKGAPIEKAVVSSELVDTQVEVITSREMAGRVAEALGLDNGLTDSGYRNLVDELQRNVSAERTGRSYAITISYDAADGKSAAERVNEFARQFANWQLREHQERDRRVRELMEQRLVNLREQAQQDTQALQQYRIANNLLSTSGASLTEQEISTYNQEVSRARAEAAEDQARLRTAIAQLRSGSSGDDVGEALNSPVISSLRLQESQAAAEAANLASKYGPNHPHLIRVRSQLEEVRDRIEAEIGRVISNLRAKEAVSAQRLASLGSSLANARGNLTQNNAAMVGLSELQRSAQASEEIYESYLSRYKQLLASEGSETPNAQILTQAEIPLKPQSPNLKLNLALSLVIGLGLGVLSAYVAEALYHGITRPDEIEQEFGLRYLASIPLLKSVDSKGQRVATAVEDDPRSAFSESFRTLSGAITQAADGKGQIIAITSALPDEGKTVTASCLSHTLARSGKRTILIDCDLRQSGISRLLNLSQGQTGLFEVLEGKVKFRPDVLDRDYVFWILPLSPNSADKEHLLTGQPFIDLLEQLRETFDCIVLDLPPVLPVASARILASRADATVMVARWYKTSKYALRAALRRLPPDQVNLAGVALSQVDLHRRAYFDQEDPVYYYSVYREYYA